MDQVKHREPFLSIMGPVSSGLLDRLPNEVLVMIIKILPSYDLMRFAAANKRIRILSENDLSEISSCGLLLKQEADGWTGRELVLMLLRRPRLRSLITERKIQQDHYRYYSRPEYRGPRDGTPNKHPMTSQEAATIDKLLQDNPWFNEKEPDEQISGARFDFEGLWFTMLPELKSLSLAPAAGTGVTMLPTFEKIAEQHAKASLSKQHSGACNPKLGIPLENLSKLEIFLSTDIPNHNAELIRAAASFPNLKELCISFLAEGGALTGGTIDYPSLGLMFSSTGITFPRIRKFTYRYEDETWSSSTHGDSGLLLALFCQEMPNLQSFTCIDWIYCDHWKSTVDTLKAKCGGTLEELNFKDGRILFETGEFTLRDFHAVKRLEIGILSFFNRVEVNGPVREMPLIDHLPRNLEELVLWVQVRDLPRKEVRALLAGFASQRSSLLPRLRSVRVKIVEADDGHRAAKVIESVCEEAGVDFKVEMIPEDQGVPISRFISWNYYGRFFGGRHWLIRDK